MNQAKAPITAVEPVTAELVQGLRLQMLKIFWMLVSFQLARSKSTLFS